MLSRWALHPPVSIRLLGESKDVINRNSFLHGDISYCMPTILCVLLCGKRSINKKLLLTESYNYTDKGFPNESAVFLGK